MEERQRAGGQPSTFQHRFAACYSQNLLRGGLIMTSALHVWPTFNCWVPNSRMLMDQLRNSCRHAEAPSRQRSDSWRSLHECPVAPKSGCTGTQQCTCEARGAPSGSNGWPSMAMRPPYPAWRPCMHANQRGTQKICLWSASAQQPSLEELLVNCERGTRGSTVIDSVLEPWAATSSRGTCVAVESRCRNGITITR
jgi:hypothetical protein